MRAGSTGTVKTYYYCTECNQSQPVPRPPIVPPEPVECPYHHQPTTRISRLGIPWDVCPEPGCMFRHKYLGGRQLTPIAQTEDHSAR
jgi:hypothetical protein